MSHLVDPLQRGALLDEQLAEMYLHDQVCNTDERLAAEVGQHDTLSRIASKLW